MPAESDSGDSAISPAERARLIPSLSTRAQLYEIERLSINAARKWAMRDSALRRSDLLSEGFSRELHGRMFRGIWRGAGKYRTTARDPGWEPHRIAEGMGMFFDDAEGWLRYSTYPVHEVAVRLHHRLVSIHPWSNGNGRHARLIADIVVAAGGEMPLTWGSKSASDGAESARDRYLEAVRAADTGDIARLLEFARG
jgi:Fic-DOC domain mobile mystery protein B